LKNERTANIRVIPLVRGGEEDHQRTRYEGPKRHDLHHQQGNTLFDFVKNSFRFKYFAVGTN
jgi:hypothetical protein